MQFVDEGLMNIIGNVDVADVDGDGFVEVFVPAWTQGQLKVFTFAP